MELDYKKRVKLKFVYIQNKDSFIIVDKTVNILENKYVSSHYLQAKMCKEKLNK